MKTEKRMMTLADFTAYAKAEVEVLEAAPNPERYAFLKAAMVKSSEATAMDSQIEVEVVVDEPPPADMSDISAKLDRIEAAVSKFEAGIVEKATHDALIAKQGIAVQLAIELLTAYQTKVAALTAQLQAGGDDLDRDKVWNALSSWDVQDAVSTALTSLGKSETPPDEAALAEVGETLKAAFALKAEAIKVAAEAAKKEADEAAAAAAALEESKKVDTCEQCGAAMNGADVCPECGWKVGEAVTEKRKIKSNAIGDYPRRYTGKTEDK